MTTKSIFFWGGGEEEGDIQCFWQGGRTLYGGLGILLEDLITTYTFDILISLWVAIYTFSIT